MDQGKPVAIGVVALRAVEYYADGKDLIISVTTKYSAAERRYSVPIECFFDFIVDLRRLNADATETSGETATTLDAAE